MSDADLRDQIARLEARIEQLAEGAGRCRRIIQISNLAILAGAVWMAAVLLGLLRFDAATLIGVTVFVIGGIVVSGSNSSTLKEMLASIEGAETARARLIGMIELRIVPDSIAE